MKNDKLVTRDTLAYLCRNYREAGKKIVFTNGCFDILHAGHVHYLQQAKALGDILIVGMNTDASVKALKGGGRPINGQEERAYVLSGLGCIDHVVLFNELTPLALITALKPDFLVKGGDWKPKDIVGSDVVLAAGGEVRSLPYTDGFSSTSVIDKIIKMAGN